MSAESKVPQTIKVSTLLKAAFITTLVIVSLGVSFYSGVKIARAERAYIHAESVELTAKTLKSVK